MRLDNASPHPFVIPAQAGIQQLIIKLVRHLVDPRLREDDDEDIN